MMFHQKCQGVMGNIKVIGKFIGKVNVGLRCKRHLKVLPLVILRPLDINEGIFC